MPDYLFTIIPSRLAPRLYAAAYGLSLLFLFLQLQGFWLLGFVSGWLYCAARDLRTFGLASAGRIEGLRYRRDTWQQWAQDTWQDIHCSREFRCPAYLLLAMRDEQGEVHRITLWRDSLCAKDWHRLNIYLDIVAENKASSA